MGGLQEGSHLELPWNILMRRRKSSSYYCQNADQMSNRSGARRGSDSSPCISNGSSRSKVPLKGGSGVFMSKSMHRTTGPGRLGVKWWRDSGNSNYAKPVYDKDSEGASRYGHNWHTKAFVFWVVFMGAVSVSVYLAMRFDMLERRRENLANLCEAPARMLEVSAHFLVNRAPVTVRINIPY